MKSNFISIRFDRLKYFDLLMLYEDIQKVLRQYDAASLHLSVAFDRFHKQSELLSALNTLDRTKYDQEGYRNHFKRLDSLVSALLLHLKALKRADFPEQSYDVTELNKLLRKELGNFIHVGTENKKAALDGVSWCFLPSGNNLWMGSMKKLGLIRYAEEISATRKMIDSMEQMEKRTRKGQTKSAEAIKAKAEVIQELRLLLQIIDVAALTHPEVDYTPLINILNLILKTHRAQLRNLQTRRERKKERETEKEREAEKERETDKETEAESSLTDEKDKT